MTITGASLIRATGLAAIMAGIIFAAIQPIHPADVLASVTSSYWTVIMVLKLVMCFLFLFAIAGLYARQLEEAGWLGLAGALLFSLCWMLQIGYVFTELFILPAMATAAPSFVDSFLGIVNGRPGEMAIGALGPVYGVLGILYLLGGLCLGIATFRAGVLPRWPAGLLAITALLTPLAALLPHEVQRLAAVPMGLAFAWLGYALWSERRVDASRVAQAAGPSLSQTAAG
ncbi:hypothetical protein [Rubellimicrobium arenae]|uniref:hypothetical protein n=1 Tax=Rubellimicrobium arenae TaxID=2817372 RepID=UPI001B3177DA|nr:hypothetical protein [Rubellimicrobium arenae]